MRIAVFSTKPYDREALDAANERHGHSLLYLEPRLTPLTAALAREFEAVCPFVNDQVSAEVVDALADGGVRLLTLRSAGFNHIDLRAADARGITVTRVPAYSPYAVAEHAAGLILTLNRRLHRAYARVREGNFSLNGLLGFDLHGKTVGVVGTGNIGKIFCRIMIGFGCRVVAYDPYPSEQVRDLGAEYVELDELLKTSDVIALHLPLTPETRHLIDAAAVDRMKNGVMLINTSRGGLVDTRAVIEGLKRGRIGGLGLDVYEEEEGLFFEDLSGTVIQDDVFARLLTFPNVLITGHQGFFTREALANIAETTLANATAFETGRGKMHTVAFEAARGG
jgi:D-lactate dehydrogenase